MASDQPELGQLKNNNFSELINNQKFRNIRMDFLNNRKPKNCSKCFEIEKNGMKSFREFLNKKFAHHFEKAKDTLPDGEIKNFQMAYFDIRFSNICNFKCRTCGPGLSSSWYKDEKILNPEYSDNKKIILQEKVKTLWSNLDLYLDQVEEINFAGGEPLISEEHWRILNEIDRRKRYEIKLKYTTNLSTLYFKEFYGPDLWKKFKNVCINISLDDIGYRAEYLRKGLKWKKMIENINTIKKTCPEALIVVVCTVSNLNAYYLTEFCEYFLQNEIVAEENIRLNLLLNPPRYRAHNLPTKFKQKIEFKYQQFISKLRQNQIAERESALIGLFNSILVFMQQENKIKDWQEFKDITFKLDAIRSEEINSIYPEISHYLLEKEE